MDQVSSRSTAWRILESKFVVKTVGFLDTALETQEA
jgi:hypothetical protein